MPIRLPRNLTLSDEVRRALGDTAERPAAPSQRLVSAVRRSEASRYQADFHAFLIELVWTRDEAGGGEVRKFPDWPLFRDLTDDLITEPLLFLDKSRRVLGSWTVCAFDVWLMAGGQDPRWPALMRSTSNRQVILAAGKLKDISGSAWYLDVRVKPIVEELEKRDIRSVWPDFPEFKFTFSEATASNGSRLNAVPEGADQCRGAGATFVHMEEVARWDQAQASVESAKMVTLGGGHCCCIATAKVGTYAAALVMDEIGEGATWR